MSLEQQQTIGKAFRDAVARHRERPLLAVPASDQRDYLRGGIELSYGECLSRVEQLRGGYERAGYGHGHRVATLLDNRPEYLLHKLALNELGVSVAPINPQYRPAEMAYLLDHCTPDLLLVLPAQEALSIGSRRITRRSMPRPKRACCTPRARPAGPRAACCRTVMNWPWATGMPRVAAR